MLNSFYENMGLSSPTTVIIGLALMLLSGFLMTRLTKLLRLPAVTGYLLAGIIIGPSVLDLVPSSVTKNMDFLSDVALCFIAFSAGEYLRLPLLKKKGAKSLVIALFETLGAGILTFVALFFIFDLPLPLVLTVSALASTTSPTSTIMTIRQTGAKGDFVNTLISVLAIDLIVGILFYSTAISVSSALMGGEFSLWAVFSPLLINVGVMLLGGACGFIMKFLLPPTRSSDNRLIISLALIFAFCGVCAFLSVSPLLGCMSMGAVYINLTGNEKLFKQLNYFSPPFLLLFFVKSGIEFNIGALFSGGSYSGVSLALVALVYFIVRMLGTCLGASSGALLVTKNDTVIKNLGLALISQAGVAIALSSLGARTLGGEIGSALVTIIVTAGMAYELIGPVLASLSLKKSKCYDNLEEATEEVVVSEEKSEVDILIERINAIRKENPPLPVEENENAFLEGAEEMYAFHRPRRRGRW